jgi:hypothetical protein
MIYTLHPRVIKKTGTRKEGPFDEIIEDIETGSYAFISFR